jgi:rifampin ADP-ribosylating transferase
MDTPIDPNNPLPSEQFYYGTKANLKPGYLIEPGFSSNYEQRKKAKYIYFTATLEAAIWGAELANPTKSYRFLHPFRVIGEVTSWQAHTTDQLKAMKETIERAKELGIEAIED